MQNFVTSLVKKAGYPRWDKSRASKRHPLGSARTQAGSTEQLFIPFISEEGDQTKAILMVRINGTDTLFHLQYDTRYSESGFDAAEEYGEWNAQQVFAAFTLFDHEILGSSHFKLFDNRVLHGTTDTIGFDPVIVSISDSTADQPAGRTLWEVRSWVTYMVCHWCPARSASSARLSEDPGPCCNAEYFTVEVVYWIEDGEEEWEWEWFPVGNTGGGSSCVGCDWSQTNPCTPPPPGEPWTEICDETWQPIPNAVPEPFDPYKYDSVKVDDEIADSFPCVHKLLTEDLRDINKTSQIIMYNLFAVSKYDHVFFKLDYGLCGSDTNATTHRIPQRPIINGNLHFIDTIALNPCFLQRASRESITSVILHEMIHAYIVWCLAEYSRDPLFGPIDSNYLKLHFPLHWDKFVGKAYSHSYDHDVMATTYIDSIANVIMRTGNQSAPLALRQWVAKSLAAGGLERTSAWGEHTNVLDTCNIKTVLHWSHHHKPYTGQYTGVVPYPGCRHTYSTFRDSLQLLPGDSCQ